MEAKTSSVKSLVVRATCFGPLSCGNTRFEALKATQRSAQITKARSLTSPFGTGFWRLTSQAVGRTPCRAVNRGDSRCAGALANRLTAPRGRTSNPPPVACSPIRHGTVIVAMSPARMAVSPRRTTTNRTGRTALWVAPPLARPSLAVDSCATAAQRPRAVASGSRK